MLILTLENFLYDCIHSLTQLQNKGKVIQLVLALPLLKQVSTIKESLTTGFLLLEKASIKALAGDPMVCLKALKDFRLYR